MRNVILRKIVETTKNAKHLLTIADCTPDVSHIGLLLLTTKAVGFNTIQNKYENEESFIDFLTEIILTHLEKISFQLKWLRE